MPRILITGAAGFLGSHLCDRFIREGYEVVAMDNLITGDLRNLEHLQSLPHFSFVHHDVSRRIELSGPLDYILHFASPASPIDYLKIPIQTLKVGSLGTHNCLGLALAKNARILVASTSEVYGDPLVHPQTEDYWGNVNPIGPRGVYDEAKRFQEAMTMAYHTYHGLETRIVRIFNTYGPRMRLNDGRVLPARTSRSLATAAKRGVSATSTTWWKVFIACC
jgi:dTDP-glucose 4,6-dehydratase